MARSCVGRQKVLFLRMKKLFPEVHQEITPHQPHISLTGIMTHAMPKPSAGKGKEITMTGLGFTSQQERVNFPE